MSLNHEFLKRSIFENRDRIELGRDTQSTWTRTNDRSLFSQSEVRNPRSRFLGRARGSFREAKVGSPNCCICVAIWRLPSGTEMVRVVGRFVLLLMLFSSFLSHSIFQVAKQMRCFTRYCLGFAKFSIKIVVREF